MPERVNSFAPVLPCVFLALVATVAVDFVSPVRAESANGRDITPSQAQPSSVPTPAPVDLLSSQIASLLGSLTAAAENAMPQVSAPPADAPQTGSARAPHKPRGNGAKAMRADNGLRGEQKGAGEGRGAAKRVSSPLTEPEREALFEEFLRWQEIDQTIGAPSR
jgi:hypothetical protein